MHQALWLRLGLEHQVSQERQGVWLPKDDLKDSSSWSSTPLVLLQVRATRVESEMASEIESESEAARRATRVE